MKRKQYRPAHELVDEIVENLKPKPKPGPKYLVKHQGLNRAERRANKLYMQRDLRRFTRWWLRMERLGFDPQEVLRQREERESREEAATTDAV